MHRKKEPIVVDTVYCINCGAAIWIIASTVIAPLPGLLHALYFRHHCHHHCFCFACCCMSNPASLASSAESGFASSPRLSCTASAISDTGHKWEGKNYLSVPTLWNMLKINQTKYCITTITALWYIHIQSLSYTFLVHICKLQQAIHEREERRRWQ